MLLSISFLSRMMCGEKFSPLHALGDLVLHLSWINSYNLRLGQDTFQGVTTSCIILIG